jgi:hypothetical protein
MGRFDPPATPGRRVRIPQLAVGLLLSAGAALAFVLWNAASVQRTPVAALANDVIRGHILTSEDLRLVHVGTDDAVAMTPFDSAGQLLGRAAITDLQAGALLTQDQFAIASTLTPGAGVVGLSLSPGQFPTPQLRIGDLVNVIVPSEDGRPAGQLLVEAAEVVWIEPVGTQGQRFISLLTGEDLAGAVATAAAQGEVRLVLVARDSGEDEG